MSHPTWVRGLKCQEGVPVLRRDKSHPTWVRGLKLFSQTWHPVPPHVAPHVGAWIEM